MFIECFLLLAYMKNTLFLEKNRIIHLLLIMKVPKRLVLILVFILSPVLLFAQVDTLRLNKYYAKKYWSDSKEVVTAPFHWDGHDWTKFAVFTGTTASMFFVDDEIRDASQSFRNYSGETGKFISANFLEPFGGKYSLAVTGSFLVYGLLANDSKSGSTGLLALESFLISSAFVRIPKYMFGRTRPYEHPNVSPFDFKGPGGGHSFPSGHTIAVFSVASVIANQYADTKWVPIVSYSVAGLTGFSRVFDNKHWASDVLMSGILGTLIGNMVCNKKNNDSVSIVPFQTGSVKGIRLAFKL